MDGGFIPLGLGLLLIAVALLSSNHGFLNGLIFGLFDYLADMTEIRRRRAPATYWLGIVVRSFFGLLGLALVVVGVLALTG